jgi:hypothetical protein
MVATSAEADAILAGTGEIWIKGYFHTNPKPSAYNRQAEYDGYLSVELRGKDNVVLWSCHATPGKWFWNGVPEDLANQQAKKLHAALRPNAGAKH